MVRAKSQSPTIIQVDADIDSAFRFPTDLDDVTMFEFLSIPQPVFLISAETGTATWQHIRVFRRSYKPRIADPVDTWST